jgi:ASC-1-like (ASCH) protein
MMEIVTDKISMSWIISGHKEWELCSAIPSFERNEFEKRSRGFWHGLEKGDKFILTDGSGFFTTTRVTVYAKKILTFSSFKDALEWCGFKRVLPGTSSIEEAIEICRQLYSEEYGVIAIKIKK